MTRTVINVRQFPVIDEFEQRLDAVTDVIRVVVDVQLVGGHLIITFSDGTTLDLGLIGGGVIVPPIPITISGTPPLTGQIGQAYAFAPTTANGSGAKVFALASGTLLGGMSFNTTTGAITGSPTVAGLISNLSIRVTDNTGSATTTPVNVTIAAAPIVATLDNTLGTSTIAGTSVQNYGPGYADQLRAALATAGYTMTTPNSAPVADFVNEIEAACADLETVATIDNTLGTSTLPGNAVSGFASRVQSLDARFTALGG